MQIVNALTEVFTKPKYLLYSIIISVAIFFFFVLVNNIPSIISVLGISHSPVLILEVIANAISNIIYAGGTVNFLAILAVAVLSGITISMLLYSRFKSKDRGLVGFVGIFGGALSAACPLCSGALISMAGIVGGLAIFPYKGLEFSVISVSLLILSLYFISKNIECKECKV